MSALNDEILRVLLRFFRSGDEVELAAGELQLSEDLEYLRIQWALSKHVEELAHHLLKNRHEAQASLEFVRVDGSSGIRGRLLPVRTIIRRRLSGDVTQVSFSEPRRNFTEGPNHVLAWVLRYSHHIVQAYLQLLTATDHYGERVRRLFRHLSAIQQLKGIGEAIGNTNLRGRPSVKSLTQAGKSRKRLYRKAFDAYQLLARIESGSSTETVAMLSGSLVGPLEEWRKFELLLGYKLSKALAEALGETLVLLPIQIGSTARPIAQFGNYDVFWQNRSDFREPDPEPSERIAREIIRSYGLHVGGDRPDIVIYDRVRQVVVAIAEAKFSESGSADDAFRDATQQVVRYSRLYLHCTPQGELLRRSVIAVSNLSAEIRAIPTPGSSPVAIGLPELLEGTLSTWVSRARAFCEASSA